MTVCLNWYSLFLTVDCISFYVFCFIMNNCLIYLLTSFFKVLSVFPKLARRIIELSKYSTVSTWLNTSRSLISSLPAAPSSPIFPSLQSHPSLPSPSLSSAFFPLLSPTSWPARELCKEFPSPFSYERSCCLDLGVFLIFLFCLLPYFSGAYVLKVS